MIDDKQRPIGPMPRMLFAGSVAAQAAEDAAQAAEDAAHEKILDKPVVRNTDATQAMPVLKAEKSVDTVRAAQKQSL